jgi:hypothetical protein
MLYLLYDRDINNAAYNRFVEPYKQWLATGDWF